MSVSLDSRPSGPAIGDHLVASSDGSTTYTVYVAFDGRVNCTCADFTYRHAAKNPTVDSPGIDLCKHIRQIVKASRPAPQPAIVTPWYAPAPTTTERTCTVCDGVGIFPADGLDFPKPHRCSACKGTGTIPMVIRRTPAPVYAEAGAR